MVTTPLPDSPTLRFQRYLSLRLREDHRGSQSRLRLHERGVSAGRVPVTGYRERRHHVALLSAAIKEGEQADGHRGWALSRHLVGFLRPLVRGTSVARTADFRSVGTQPAVGEQCEPLTIHHSVCDAPRPAGDAGMLGPGWSR